MQPLSIQHKKCRIQQWNTVNVIKITSCWIAQCKVNIILWKKVTEICNKLCNIYTMALFFFTKKHLVLYMDHQLAYISQTIISSLSIRKITLVFFACACVHACVHVYVYIYIHIWQGMKVQALPKCYTNNFIIMEVMAFYWNVLVWWNSLLISHCWLINWVTINDD